MSLYDFPPAQGGWHKYEGNPVLGNASLGTCFDVYVVRDEEGIYRMYFSWRPKKSLAVCTSRDGIRWSEPEILLTPNPASGWEDNLNRNCVLRKEDGYHMWYTGQAHGNSWIGYASSTDGHNWIRKCADPVLVPEQPWEGMSVMNPCVLWDQERQLYQMWYSGGETYEPNALGYAESPDGIQWTKRRANPIFTAQPENLYERERVGGCQVIRQKDRYLLFYIGYEDINTARICVASSPNGVTQWRRLASNPILSPSEGSWDGESCYKPGPLWDEEKQQWMLWYNGRNKQPEYICLALHPGFDLGFEE